jgi:hypothetical protein
MTDYILKCGKKSTKSNTPKGLGVPQVAIYARISDDREGKEAGVKNQEKACRAYVQEKGWQVKEVYIDNDISASQSKKKREDYERLLIDLKAGVIVRRIAKNFREKPEYKNLCYPRFYS